MIRLNYCYTAPPEPAEKQEETVLLLPLPKLNGYTKKIAEIKKASDEALKRV